MKCTIVGIIITSKGYVYHATRESKSSKIVGCLTLTFFSKVEHLIGEDVDLMCSARDGVFYYYERKK